MNVQWLEILMATSDKNYRAARGIDNGSTTCTSAKCVEFAKTVKSALAPNYLTVDPCADFSTYACDGWRQTHTLATGSPVIDMFTIMEENNEKILRSILDGEFVKETTFPKSDRVIARDNFNKMKTSYTSCMDEAAIKKAGIMPLRKLLDGFELLYPVKSGSSGTNSSSSNQELTNVLIWLAQRTTPTFINIAVAPDLKNPQASISMVSVDNGIPGSYYNNETIMTNYTNTLVQMYRIVWDREESRTGSSNTSARYLETAKKVIKLERQLIKASNSNESDTSNTLADLDKAIPQISITNLLNAQAPTTYTIKSINGQLAYLKRLSTILTSTSREVLHAYFQTSIIRTFASKLDKIYNEPLNRFRNISGDDFYSPPTERWKVCLGEVQDNLDYILASAFLDKAFSPEAKVLSDRVVGSILEALTSRLGGLDWMTNSTKTVAKQKLATIISDLGYLTSNPNVIDAADIRAFYKNITITTSYFDNSVEYSKSQARKTWDSLLTGDLWDVSRMRITSATAFYARNDHRIVIPAGIMQVPMFSPDLPEYVSYGGLGSIIGHELTHSVDAGAQEFGTDGSSIRWWDNTTTAGYEKKANCFIKQYSNYTFKNEKGGLAKVNGQNTLQENLADCGGISSSYQAWKKLEKKRPNAGLPGLETFTPDQLFFLSYARTWCAVVDSKLVGLDQKFDVHSPREARILATLSNSRGFREAFGCKVKEPTCELW
ncbi:putative endothelin-converting enzyme protein [Venturia nashicola]|nr:putative endothelin-converting enzyme protein [Venturia nashicola]